MKRFLVAILGVLMILSLCACSSSDAGTSSVYTVNMNGTDYVVDPDNRTISDGKHTYQYDLTVGSSNYSIEITYPDGSTFWWNAQTSGGVTTGGGGWSDDYDAGRYVDGQTLCDVIEERAPQTSSNTNVFLIFVLIAVGIFNTVWPRAAWYLEYGWCYKNAEPSDLVLGLNRVGGIIAIIVAVIMAFT